MKHFEFGRKYSPTGLYANPRDNKIREDLESPLVSEHDKDALIAAGLAEVRAVRSRVRPGWDEPQPEPYEVPEVQDAFWGLDGMRRR